MNKLMSKFDELEERIFGTPVVTLPHDAYTCGSAQPLVNTNMEGCFTIIMIKTVGA